MKMKVYPYRVGDLRACENVHCEYPIMFSGSYWVHLPKDGFFGGTFTHEPKPYPEHKHQFKILKSDDIVHYYRCLVCGWESNTSKKLVRYLTTNRWE